jgi:hypothetical protein
MRHRTSSVGRGEYEGLAERVCVIGQAVWDKQCRQHITCWILQVLIGLCMSMAPYTDNTPSKISKNNMSKMFLKQWLQSVEN